MEVGQQDNSEGRNEIARSTPSGSPQQVSRCKAGPSSPNYRLRGNKEKKASEHCTSCYANGTLSSTKSQRSGEGYKIADLNKTPETWLEFGWVHQSNGQFRREHYRYSAESRIKYQRGGIHCRQLVPKLEEKWNSIWKSAKPALVRRPRRNSPTRQSDFAQEFLKVNLQATNKTKKTRLLLWKGREHARETSRHRNPVTGEKP